MNRLNKRKSIAGIVMIAALIISFMLGSLAIKPDNTLASSYGKNWSYDQMVKSIAAHHKAPFSSQIIASQQQLQATSQKRQQSIHNTTIPAGKNIKVNQDLNPWSKTGVAAAVSPINGQDYVVMSNDSRQILNHEYYHVSTNGGRNWTDDALTTGIDQITNAPYSYQSNPGVAFDNAGHSFLSNLANNSISAYNGNYSNYDSEVDLVQGYANGTYSNYMANTIDYVPCNGNYDTPNGINCPGQLSKPSITVDNVVKSPNKNSIYVYYTYFCNGTPINTVGSPTLDLGTPTPVGALTPLHGAGTNGGGGGGPGPSNLGPCVDGGVTIPAYTSVILEAHATSAGAPFSSPNLVSGAFAQAEFSSMVIDSHGTPHIFFDDFTSFPIVNIYETTLASGSWNVNTLPLASFQYNSSNNSNWIYNSYGSIAPGCAGYKDIAYCTFTATQLAGKATVGTPNVYVVKVNSVKGDGSQISRVNNDPINDTKDHFFPWPSVSSKGSLYVGWYDSRNDPLNTKVEYFVGKSTDGGKTFPKQQAVSDVAFNPCASIIGCGAYGDYYQLVTGPDDITHATWADTRDNVSTQLYTQAISW